MRCSVVIVQEAEQQLRDIDAWWQEERASSTASFMDEFSQTVELLSEMPDIGPLFRRTMRKGVRRVYMTRSKHWLYYVHDAAHSLVFVLAVWSSFRGSNPVLPKV